MDLWKALTAISGILIILISVLLVWNALFREEGLGLQEITTAEITVQRSTTHLEPKYQGTADCLEEAKGAGAPETYEDYSCTVEFWAEPYIRGARPVEYVQDDKIGARYHHKCICTFTYLQ